MIPLRNFHHDISSSQIVGYQIALHTQCYGHDSKLQWSMVFLLPADVSSWNNIAENTKAISLSSPSYYLITYPFNRAWLPVARKYLFWPWFGYPLHLSDIICFCFLPQYLTMLILIVIKVVYQPCIRHWSWYL